MKHQLEDKRKVTPEMAVKMLRKGGIDVDEKKAKEFLDIMYFLAKLIVNQNFKK